MSEYPESMLPYFNVESAAQYLDVLIDFPKSPFNTPEEAVDSQISNGLIPRSHRDIVINKWKSFYDTEWWLKKK